MQKPHTSESSAGTDGYAFRRHVLGHWQVDPLAPYAWAYHERCEAFDKAVCSRIEQGVAIPTTADELAKVNANAKRVRQEIYVRVCKELGPRKASLLQRAIGAVSRDFERSLRVEA